MRRNVHLPAGVDPDSVHAEVAGVRCLKCTGRTGLNRGFLPTKARLSEDLRRSIPMGQKSVAGQGPNSLRWLWVTAKGAGLKVHAGLGSHLDPRGGESLSCWKVAVCIAEEAGGQSSKTPRTRLSATPQLTIRKDVFFALLKGNGVGDESHSNPQCQSRGAP